MVFVFYLSKGQTYLCKKARKENPDLMKEYIK